MSKKSKLVLDLLKPKAQPLGFTKEELEGISEKIADALSIGDDATDEALTEAAAKAVDAQMFYLELGQSQANRIIQKEKEKAEKLKAEEERKAKEEAERKAKEEEERKKAEEEEARKKAQEEEERKKAEEEGYKKFLDSEWAKRMKEDNEKLAKQLEEQQAANKKAQDDFNAFRDEFNALKAERKKAERQGQLDKLLNGTGVFGERIKKNYAKMSFDSDEEFTEFINGVQDDIKAFNQERANEGLAKLGNPAGGGEGEQKREEVMSDAEIDALAAIM